ncbi:MAG: 1-(5-phosphoribosyl)-5-[(5-phosphoribosylamino)methylideneamino] imidazole-4-carboxamide isomerase [Chloroflexota bacterium]
MTLGKTPGEVSFDLLPAIDLRHGRVVRLMRGDFARETVYGEDPVAVARTFVEQGARWLHVVDLDGALDPARRQLDLVAAIVAGVGERACVEVAGGLRDEDAVGDALGSGAARAVIGTAALADPGFAGCLVAAHGAGRIAVALDVRDGLAVGHGWKAGAPGVAVEDALDRLANDGVAMFEVTAIDRDGTLAGPDLELLARLVARGRGAIIASAGISTVDDVRAVRDLGCRGAIVGRALYDGTLTLTEARGAIG